MTCNSPPPVADKDLLAYLDGEAEEEVASHLARCQHCRDRAAELANWQRELRAHLYRHDCPDPLTLGEYHLNLLARDEAAAVERHLGACPHCRQEVAGLEAYLEHLQPSLATHPLDQARERVQLVIARLLNPPGQGLAPAYAGVRGEEEPLYLYEAEGMQIAIEIQDDAEAPGHKVILGLATGEKPPGGEAFLWQAGRQVTTVPIDDLGNFVIPHLELGNYDLIVSGPRLEVHIEKLEVGVT